MIEFKTLETVPVEEILEAHNVAFSEYEVPMELSLAVFQHSNQRRGVKYELSMGAFNNGKLIGFILNGIGRWNGLLTAYDCGTGVIQEFQGQKVASALLQQVTSMLLAHNINRYLLEVIKTNTAAFQLYSKKGFQIIRSFECMVVEKKKIHLNLPEPGVIPYPYSIKEIMNPDWAVLQSFWDFPPSWQNSIDSITRTQTSFTILVLYHKKQPIGYGVVEPRSGGITQLAIHPDYRRQKLGSFLLLQLCEKCPAPPKMLIINIDTRITNLLKWCESVGFQSFTTQYEMMKQFE
ncbi:MAG: GNAT family N-acetyltransferase [Promethearchaeota archaeon]